MKKLLYTFIFLLISGQCFALDVVPGLKVFGGTTRAAYGNSTNPTIYCINTLNPTTALSDSTRNGVAVKQGGFISAINHSVNNKLIIFEVSGYITVNGQVDIDNNYVTIAGQTAPSPGITIRNGEFVLDAANHDILIQHIRIRMDDCVAGEPYSNRDGINIYSYNAVVDHISVSWGMDECAGIGGGGNNSTISNSILAEGLYDSYHSDGPHSRGMISDGGVNLGIVNNLFIHNYERNPYFTNNSSRLNQVLVANNLIYNAGNLGFHTAPKTTADDWNIVGNVVIGGPNSNKYCGGADATTKTPYPTALANTSNTTDFYIYGQRIEQIGQSVYQNVSANDWTRVRLYTGSDDETYCKVLSPAFSYPSGYTPMAGADVEAYVLANVGARPGDRDLQDTYSVGNVTGGTGSIIDTPAESRGGSGWETLAAKTETHTDLPSNPHADTDGDGYTNLEEWLHTLAAAVEGRILTIPPVTDLRITH